ncbi:putative kinase [Robbsia andropogonis]|uniref:AAA family ATPase n=1 Tax=Robbsia andropogonis TaxID=28092 RepID=UPI00209FD890|nr:AAA family ATPase [Robbsia andropogonis]MCP1119216.1 AAA family ATPase [Robbsia andropogonis]MCP1128933.1 AAA family ATPase [Robbsia andropogonis]
MLVTLSGLPATGKTTLARGLARKIAAAYVRIDTLEQAFIASGNGSPDIGPAGYMAGYAIARDNLHLGIDVVADAANLLDVTRRAWRAVAHETGVRHIEVELVCSDKALHRERVEQRVANISNHALPTWQSVIDRPCDVWDVDHLVIDTAKTTVDMAIESVIQTLSLPSGHYRAR